VTNGGAAPDGWEPLSEQLDQIAETLRWYLNQSPHWSTDSLAEAQLQMDADYQDLPFQSPVTTALLRPLAPLGHAQDHLVALSAVIRAPDTILSILTLLRTFLVACGRAHYLADPAITVRERVRRCVNAELDTATAMMNFADRSGPVFAGFEQKRRDLMKGARALRFHGSNPEPRKGAKHFPAWYVGDKPPSDMARMDMLSGSVPTLGADVFRLLSASAHAQEHALYQCLRSDMVRPSGPGYSSVAVGLSGERLLMWLVVAGLALQETMERCQQLYKWDRLRWNSAARPYLVDWHAQLGASIAE
jgi:hypothetical protein